MPDSLMRDFTTRSYDDPLLCKEHVRTQKAYTYGSYTIRLNTRIPLFHHFPSLMDSWRCPDYTGGQ